MEDGAQLVVLERDDVKVPWGFTVVPCPDGVARITQVGADSLAYEYGLCDGDRVIQVGQMKVDPRDGLNFKNVELFLRMPTPQLELVVLRDDFLDRNLGSVVPKRKLQEFRPLPRRQSTEEDIGSQNSDAGEKQPLSTVKALAENWEHLDQEGFEPTRPSPGHLPADHIEVDEQQRREALLRQEKYELERQQNEEFEQQKIFRERRDSADTNMADQNQENVRVVEETLPDGTKIIRRIITKKASQASPMPVTDGEREVQEFEDTLPDGTKVIRRVIRTKRPAQQVQQQLQQQSDDNVSIRQVEETLPDGTRVLRTYRTVKKQVQQQSTTEGVTDENEDDDQRAVVQQQTRQQQQVTSVQRTQQTRSGSPPPRALQSAPEPRKAPQPQPRSRSPPPRPLQSTPEPYRPQDRQPQPPKSRSPPPPSPRQYQHETEPPRQLQQQQQQQPEPPKRPQDVPQPPSQQQQQQQPVMQKPPSTPRTQRRMDRNWEEQQRREFEEYLQLREQQGPPPQGPKSNVEYVSKYQEQLQKRRPSQNAHQPGSIEEYRRQYEQSLRRDSAPMPVPPPGANTDYIRMYEETLKKKEEIDRQRAEERFERAQCRTQEEYKRFYEDELRRKQALEQEQEEERRRLFEEQSKQRENILRSKELYQQQLQKDMQKKEHLVKRPTELRPERVCTQANHWERIASEERAKLTQPTQVPPSPKLHRRNLDACWPPKREDGVLVRPAFSRENSFHGSSRRVYQWPPPRASSMDRDFERPSTPSSQLKHDINWNKRQPDQDERMTTPPPFARSPQLGRRNVVWPPQSPQSEQKPFFEPGQRRGSQTASLEDYLAQQHNPTHIPATYRPPPGTSHYEQEHAF